MGKLVGNDALLRFDALPSRAVYLRAEISDASGCVVCTQPFVIRPAGDANVDGRVNAADDDVCAAAAAGTKSDPDRVSACQQQ
jgi:hypothetical protein